MGLCLRGDEEGGEGDCLNLGACFLPLEKMGLEDGWETASGGGCCLQDCPGEDGWLILFLSDPLGEAIGLEGGDCGRTVNGVLLIPMPSCL